MTDVVKTISLVSPCYDEDKVRGRYERTKAVMAQFPNYCYEHIFIDNLSRDRTVPIPKEIAEKRKIATRLLFGASHAVP